MGILERCTMFSSPHLNSLLYASTFAVKQDSSLIYPGVESEGLVLITAEPANLHIQQEHISGW